MITIFSNYQFIVKLNSVIKEYAWRQMLYANGVIINTKSH